jgi:hypothetical protein
MMQLLIRLSTPSSSPAFLLPENIRADLQDSMSVSAWPTASLSLSSTRVVRRAARKDVARKDDAFGELQALVLVLARRRRRTSDQVHHR